MASSIFMVEDDALTAKAVEDFLGERGFKVRHFQRGEDALRAVFRRVPDLLILDLGLEGISGMNLCETLRRDPRTAALPILMLTSMGREADKVRGLKAGADDYLAKPFSVRELEARIEALLRRSKAPAGAGGLLEASGISMNLESLEVTVKGKPLNLTPKEFALLQLFLKNPGRVYPRPILAESVWGDERLVTADALENLTARLRAKLGPLGSKIQTVSGMGYKLAGEE